MLNSIAEKGLSVKHNVKVENCPGRTSGEIIEKLDDFIKDKPFDLVTHVGTNDLTNRR